MPAMPKMPGAAPDAGGISKESMLFAVIAALGLDPEPDLNPPVTGF